MKSTQSMLQWSLLLVMALIIPLQSMAQPYQSPSRELVERLLDELDTCKQLIKESEADLKTMEANAGDFTLNDYLEVKRLIDRAQSCVNSRRAQLEDLRKEYPGWFNSPNATMNIRHGNLRAVTPRTLESILQDVEGKIAQVLNDFGRLPQPEQ